MSESSQERQGLQTEREQRNLERSITIDQFIERIEDKSLNEIRYYREGDPPIEIGPLKIDRPRYTEDSWRYVRDPRNPDKYIDMDHFFATADLHSYEADEVGLGVELSQFIRRNQSGFAESDIRSNWLGERYGTGYYKILDEISGVPLKDSLRK
jgi:hypothetical protein